MTVKGGSRPACAACRFQRRRCSSDCPLAPFFPANQPKIFQNVHSLYGVGHILKILSQLKNEDQKEDAMKSIQYESNIRQIHRVHGCYGVIIHLQQKMAESIQELRHVRGVLDAYKKLSIDNSHISHNVTMSDDHIGGGGTSDWVTAMINGGNDNLGFYYNPANDSNNNNNNNNNNNGYVWDDDQAKATVDSMTMNQARFDEFQPFCNVVDDQQTPYDLNLESSLNDASYFIEPGEMKLES